MNVTHKPLSIVSSNYYKAQILLTRVLLRPFNLAAKREFIVTFATYRLTIYFTLKDR
jgi:hypothetical protein